MWLVKELHVEARNLAPDTSSDHGAHVGVLVWAPLPSFGLIFTTRLIRVLLSCVTSLNQVTPILKRCIKTSSINSVHCQLCQCRELFILKFSLFSFVCSTGSLGTGPRLVKFMFMWCLCYQVQRPSASSSVAHYELSPL